LEKTDNKTTIEALKQGDRQAFDALFRLYYEPLCHYAASMTDGDMDEAEDIVQERFFKLWEKRSEVDINFSVKSYLYKMVHNACLNRIRNEKTRTKYKEYKVAQIDGNPEMPSEGVFELQAHIQKAIAGLPDQCRHVFELNRFEDLKYKDIAEQLGISIKTVENHIGKALRILRTELVDYIAVIWFFYFL
jgi:RNA polymerase sigma-70 factor (family 1)